MSEALCNLKAPRQGVCVLHCLEPFHCICTIKTVYALHEQADSP